MRAAICFSGMPRSFKTVYQSHQDYIIKVLKKQDIKYDIFIHTWDNKIKYPKYLPDDGNVNELIELYDAALYKIETYNQDKIQKLYIDSKVKNYQEYITQQGYTQWKSKTQDIAEWRGGGLLTHNTISLFYGLNEVNKLRKQYEIQNGFKYDIIIKSRFDNIMFDELNPLTLNNTPNTVYCPLGYEPDDREKLGTVNDILAVGDSFSMDVYMSLYNRLHDLLVERFNLKHPRPWHTIGLTKHNLIKNKINIKRFYLDHIVTRRLHKYKALNSVVTGEGWNVPVMKTNKITTESNRWI